MDAVEEPVLLGVGDDQVHPGEPRRLLGLLGGIAAGEHGATAVRRAAPRPAALRELRAATWVTVQELTTWRSASSSEPTTRCPAARNSRARRSISAWFSLQPRLVK